MQLSSDYETISADDQTGGLLLRQISTGSEISVPGLLLEAAFETSDNNRLLWLSDDCPFEEGLHILLLDRTGQVLDAVETKTVYTAGILDIRAVAPDHIDFTFFDRACMYRLTVGHTPKLRLRPPPGWTYPGFRFFHPLALNRLSGVAVQSDDGGAQQT